MGNKSSNRRILMIEDNAGDACLLKRALRQHRLDCEVIVLDDGGKAIDYLHHCAPDQKPDMVIVDLHLPKEDGIEVLKKYRASPAFVETRMVVLTSSESAFDRQRAETIGVSAYLQKPTRLNDFLEVGGAIKRLFEPALLTRSAT
jgi:CheY-like chemotaxis protein